MRKLKSVAVLAATVPPASEKWRSLFNFIIRFFEEYRNAPLTREMCEALDIIYDGPHRTSKSTVSYLLNNIEARGFVQLQRDEKGNRIHGRIIVKGAEWKLLR